MVSVSPAGFNAFASTNTLSLFKSQAGEKAGAKIVAPTIEPASGDRLATIASLAAKLIDIKTGNVSQDPASANAAYEATSLEDARAKQNTADLADIPETKRKWLESLGADSWVLIQKPVSSAAADIEKIHDDLVALAATGDRPSLEKALHDGTLRIVPAAEAP